MGDLGSDQADQLDRNMWAPEEKEDTEVYTTAVCVSQLNFESL